MSCTDTIAALAANKKVVSEFPAWMATGNYATRYASGVRRVNIQDKTFLIISQMFAQNLRHFDQLFAKFTKRLLNHLVFLPSFGRSSLIAGLIQLLSQRKDRN